ncbi:hypothetical protein S83_005676 [Arachis hypogaea]
MPWHDFWCCQRYTSFGSLYHFNWELPNRMKPEDVDMTELAPLLYHFNWELPNRMKPEDVDMTELAGLAIGRKHALCLIPTVYDP